MPSKEFMVDILLGFAAGDETQGYARMRCSTLPRDVPASHQDNVRMLLVTHLAALLAISLAACTPSLNWRDVRNASGELGALLPCKPDRGSRDLPLAGRAVPVQMLGCEADGALFAIASAQLPVGTPPDLALSQWSAATLANIKASAQQTTPFVPAGGLLLASSVLVVASGQRPDGSTVQSRAVYFAQGQRVYQAVVYADKLNTQATDTFFSSFKLQ
jgi:hypothetical protein